MKKLLVIFGMIGFVIISFPAMAETPYGISPADAGGSYGGAKFLSRQTCAATKTPNMNAIVHLIDAKYYPDLSTFETSVFEVNSQIAHDKFEKEVHPQMTRMNPNARASQCRELDKDFGVVLNDIKFKMGIK